MRWFVALGLAALMFAADTRFGSAWDFGGVFGGPEWAPIPEGKGMKAFAGKWQPWDRHSFSVVGGEFYIWPNGRMGSANDHQIEYRVVKESPFYIIILTKNTHSTKTTYYFEYMITSVLENGQVTKMRSGSCYNVSPYVLGNQEIGPWTWDLSLRELEKFWEDVSPCNPNKFPPINPRFPAVFWGDQWSWGEGFTYIGPLDFPPPPLKPAAK